MMNSEMNARGSSRHACQLAVDKPAIYCIRVVGYLDANWSTRLGGMRIDSCCPEEARAITTLSGAILDQAALFGVLKALYDMRLPLLSVECLEVT
jgi:hypothetical protein